MPALTITSFGYGHAAPPVATVVIDLRKILRDPHISPRLRDMTADDPEVRDTVWRTPGATHLLNNLIALSRTLMGLHDATGAPASIAIGCSGGRHRAPPSPWSCTGNSSPPATTPICTTATCTATSSSAERTV